MSWYNEAKFGCFIHWGPYSVPAGLWKNKMQSGYTEHLMRKARIPLEEYKKELILPFNPTEFDAEEWMRHASEAGMRYFVITAKHHDGFAMYPSDAYPYDIRLSKFQKDPMEALSRAAKKYGIKFGFYYSHAFDLTGNTRTLRETIGIIPRIPVEINLWAARTGGWNVKTFSLMPRNM